MDYLVFYLWKINKNNMDYFTICFFLSIFAA